MGGWLGQQSKEEKKHTDKNMTKAKKERNTQIKI
jgi:hypothetical protein